MFNCPMGALMRYDEGCIDCGLCEAETPEEIAEAMKKLEEYRSQHEEPELKSGG